MITLVSQTQCETIYNVDGLNIRLWAIVGGQLALGTGDYQYSERFNYSPLHDSKLYNYLNWNPPVISDLEGKEETFLKFVKEAIRVLEIRELRYNALIELLGNNYGVSSVRRDSNKDRVNMTWRLEKSYCSPVTGTITGYRCRNPYAFGRCDNEISEVSTTQWKELQVIANDLFSKCRHWEDMTQRDFNLLCHALRSVV